MRFPFVSRKQYEELEERVRDLEKHFVTKRDAQGQPVETLADVPVGKRKELRMRRITNWPQQRRWLEQTDGGRLSANE